jgi:SpoVK/Ycf46/Vps4 family AAA+-type ATPase
MSSREYLADEIKCLDLLLRLYIIGEEQLAATNPDTDKEQLLQEINNLLNDDSLDLYDKGLIEAKIAQLDEEISERLAASSREGIHISLQYISNLLDLSPFEQKCIIICLAPEIDRKYEKIFCHFQDDLILMSPSIDLVMRILIKSEKERLSVRKIFDAQSPLIKFLMEQQNDLSDTRIPLIARHLKLDNWIVNYLLDIEVLDSRLSQIAQLTASDTIKTVKTQHTIDDSIVRFIDYYRNSKEQKIKQVFYLYGPDGSGKKDRVLSVCCNLNRPLIAVDIGKMLASEISFDEIIRLIGRQVMIGNTALCIENFDSILTGDGRYSQKLNSILQMINDYTSITFIIGRNQWDPIMPDTKTTFVGIEFPYPSENERKDYWREFSQSYKLSRKINIDNFSGNFRFTKGQIQAALKLGENISVWNGADDGIIGAAELSNACYTQSNKKLSTLSSKMKTTYTWDMLVLPAEQISQMREICNQVKYRAVVYEQWGFEKRLSLGKGLNILFSGPPGCGKTMSAEVIANEIGLEIYKIDVSQVVSKYIGETEKNLAEIFSEAETSNAILFFDEADALFGKRSEVKDAHDRYANVEISYLLQKMEEYKGIVILATNLNQNIDDAFLRRLHFNVAFPFPEKEQRKLIWKGMFPAAAPVENNLDYDFLAEKFILAGGNIKNIALNAAFYAANDASPIGIKQIMLAAKREYKKLGKTFLKSDFYPYYELIEVM